MLNLEHHSPPWAPCFTWRVNFLSTDGFSLLWRSYFINCFWQQDDFFFSCQSNSLKQSVIRDNVTGGSWWSLSCESTVWNPLEMQETLTWQFEGFVFYIERNWGWIWILQELRMGLDLPQWDLGDPGWILLKDFVCDLGLVKLLGCGFGASKPCCSTDKFYALKTFCRSGFMGCEDLQ